MSFYLHHLSMDLPKPSIEGGPYAGLGLETKLQIRAGPPSITSHPPRQSMPDLSSHLHCSYKQVEGFTCGTESCCAAFSHLLLDWRKRGSRGVLLCQHFGSGEEKMHKILRTGLFIRFQFIRFIWQPRSCVRERKATTLEKNPKIFSPISKVLQGHRHQC